MNLTKAHKIAELVSRTIAKTFAEGRWVTTDDGNKLLIGDDGEVKGGDAGAVAAAKGEPMPSKSDYKPEPVSDLGKIGGWSKGWKVGDAMVVRNKQGYFVTETTPSGHMNESKPLSPYGIRTQKEAVAIANRYNAQRSQSPKTSETEQSTKPTAPKISIPKPDSAQSRQTIGPIGAGGSGVKQPPQSDYKPEPVSDLGKIGGWSKGWKVGDAMVVRNKQGYFVTETTPSGHMNESKPLSPYGIRTQKEAVAIANRYNDRKLK